MTTDDINILESMKYLCQSAERSDGMTGSKKQQTWANRTVPTGRLAKGIIKRISNILSEAEYVIPSMHVSDVIDKEPFLSGLEKTYAGDIINYFRDLDDKDPNIEYQYNLLLYCIDEADAAGVKLSGVLA